MSKRVMHYVWYACVFTAITLIAEKLVGGVTGGLKKGASRTLGI